METTFVTINAVGKARRVWEGGREYLDVPMTSIVEGVLPGSKGPLYYHRDDIKADPRQWDGTTIVVYHPTHPQTGQPLSVDDPAVPPESKIGVLRNTRVRERDGHPVKLQHVGRFDVEKTRAYDEVLVKQGRPPILNRIERGEPVELSTGLFTTNLPAPAGFTDFKGRPYSGLMARNYKRDHLAVLPDQRGACSVSDGCGVLVDNAFCATGKGGGIDNSCGKSHEAIKSKMSEVMKKIEEVNRSVPGNKAKDISKRLKLLQPHVDEYEALEDVIRPHTTRAVARVSKLKKRDDGTLEVRHGEESIGTLHEETYTGFARVNGANQMRQKTGFKAVRPDGTVAGSRLKKSEAVEALARIHAEVLRSRSSSTTNANQDLWDAMTNAPTGNSDPCQCEKCKASAAAAGKKKKRPPTPPQEPTQPPEDQTVNKTSLVQWLTTNCAHFKDKADLLTGLDEAVLAGMKDDAEKALATTNSPLATNCNGNKSLTDMLKDATPQERATWNTAVKIERRERDRLINILTANTADAVKKATAVKRYEAMETEALADLVEALPPVTNAADPRVEASRPVPLYAGSAAPFTPAPTVRNSYDGTKAPLKPYQPPAAEDADNPVLNYRKRHGLAV